MIIGVTLVELASVSITVVIVAIVIAPALLSAVLWQVIQRLNVHIPLPREKHGLADALANASEYFGCLAAQVAMSENQKFRHIYRAARNPRQVPHPNPDDTPNWLYPTRKQFAGCPNQLYLPRWSEVSGREAG